MYSCSCLNCAGAAAGRHSAVARDRVIDGTARGVRRAGRFIELSPCEFDLLWLLARPLQPAPPAPSDRCRLGPPITARTGGLLPVDAVQEHGQLGGPQADAGLARGHRRPAKHALLQTLVDDDEAIVVPVEQLDAIAATRPCPRRRRPLYRQFAAAAVRQGLAVARGGEKKR